MLLRFAAVPLIASACVTKHPSLTPAAALHADSASIMRDLRVIASDRLEGRGTGTAGNDSAAAYLVRRYQALGVTAPFTRGRESASCRPAAPLTPRPSCESGFVQGFTARSVAALHAGLAGELPTQNVAAIVRGSDPALRGQFIVLGAHFDHLGRSAFGALDTDARDAIRNGADDNGSGTVAVLELARLFAHRPARRSIIFAHFSGEELGLLGSAYFVQHLPVPHDSLVAMLNFDMVGRLREDRLIVYGTATANELASIVDSANVAPRLTIATPSGDGFGASDQSSFYAAGLPVLHFFTNVHEDYHKATDDVEKINGAGIARVVELAERVARAIADRPHPLTFVKPVATAAPTASREGSPVSLGTVPDMGSDVKGVLLAGVRSGSPAEQAGLRKGDVIVEFDGKPIADLYAYSDALNAKKPGDTVTIVVLRDGQRVTLRATLGARS
jgi:hypothetical protein